ncbi:glycosyltransferase family 2 protein [Heyndrickxia faecalis]|uniref:glycosyltransferase family 2 protein n=1 Tax=Heyndrickxia TaxID=2837504 RepID=UPI002DBC6B9F|nr:glycosyltransferase family 2 protein [Weizmannia sp. CD-2023]MEC2305601.1 glycosyltransferase family 2 protein [Weizmannia sp. CD-2023]MEC2341312.1 glycosyltransferase family 2 protein [Weizmannia sp. CD-2023]
MENPVLTIVVPCYNEEAVLYETERQLTEVVYSLMNEGLISPKSNILFVDDGSRDQTWPMIEEITRKNRLVKGLKLSRNFGHQKALLAGLEKAKEAADCVISIDADLQDDISVMREFLLKFHDGCDIVYGVRKKREKDTFFKRATAQGYYRAMKKLGVDLVYNHADYRLMSKRALEELSRFPEQNLFLRGVMPLIGLQTAEVLYDRKERAAGESKYPLKKMLAFAFDGLTSFSVVPIHFITLVGLFTFLSSTIAGLYALFVKISGHADDGWASIIISIWFLGGFMLMSMGLIGEYIGKIYQETKRRPRYTIAQDAQQETISQQLLRTQQDSAKRIN